MYRVNDVQAKSYISFGQCDGPKILIALDANI